MSLEPQENKLKQLQVQSQILTSQVLTVCEEA